MPSQLIELRTRISRDEKPQIEAAAIAAGFVTKSGKPYLAAYLRHQLGLAALTWGDECVGQQHGASSKAKTKKPAKRNGKKLD